MDGRKNFPAQFFNFLRYHVCDMRKCVIMNQLSGRRIHCLTTKSFIDMIKLTSVEIRSGRLTRFEEFKIKETFTDQLRFRVNDNAQTRNIMIYVLKAMFNNPFLNN
uniref:Uncharacterized protein n=1 Tax=Caenorhabditis japonica TaxID=281687 RepID=A0A8R1IM90_CAEJA